MKYAIIKDGNVTEIHGSFTDANGVQHSRSVLDLWLGEDLAEIGVHPVIEHSVPAGKIIVGHSLSFANGVVSRVYDLEDIDIAQLKANAASDIDRQAEEERQKYITQGAGQAMTYQAKAAEASHYIETNGAGQYPFLSQEVGVTGATLSDVADVVFNMHSQWLAISAEIERVRLTAKRDINAAQTYDEVVSVKPVWPTVEV